MTDYEIAMNNARHCQEEALMVLRDAALDRGDEILAAGYTWLAENHKWPARRTVLSIQRELDVVWYWSEQTYGHFCDADDLPKEAYKILDRPNYVSPNAGRGDQRDDFGGCLEAGARGVGQYLLGQGAA